MTGKEKNIFTKRFTSRRREDFIENDRPYLLVLLLQGEFLLLDLFQLITEIKLGGFLLELGELVLVFGHFLQGWFHAERNKSTLYKKIKCILSVSIPIIQIVPRDYCYMLRCRKERYLQFTSEIVDLAVQVCDLHVLNIFINIHCIRYCDIIYSCAFIFFFLYTRHKMGVDRFEYVHCAIKYSFAM